VAAHLGTAQRRDQVAGLALQRDLAERHAFDRTAQRAETLRAILFDAGDLFVRFLQRLAHRCQQGFDGLLAFRQVAERDFLLLAECLARELQEHFVVAAQRLAGD
jgi:hypothetical protein